MNWSMPRPVLNVVAGLIAASALGAFTLGIVTAPARGRLPGERAQGDGGQAIQATEATPLDSERIEGAPPPPELTEEEKAKLEKEKAEKAEAAATARLAAAEMAKAAVEAPVAPSTPPPSPPDKVGEILEKASPPPEEPPF